MRTKAGRAFGNAGIGAILILSVLAQPVAAASGMAGMPGMEAGGKSEASGQVAAQAGAHVGDLVISGGFVRAMLPGQPVGGGYLTITNHGASDDRLLSVSSPGSGSVELHEMAMQGEVMRMRRLDEGLVIAAGQTVSLRPGATHLMFQKVKTPFRKGDSVTVSLRFEKAGSVDVVLPVLPAGQE
jgi:periplasmic copper chaperone A